MKTITFARLVNTGNYENFRLEASWQLADDEPLAPALDSLQSAVDEACARRWAAVCYGPPPPDLAHPRQTASPAADDDAGVPF